MKFLAILGVGILVSLAGLALWLWTPDRPRAGLEQKYLRSPDDRITVAGTLLHVRDDGPRGAPAVILIHGFGSSLHTWEAWARGLQDRYRVIRFDLPGSGLSEPDPTGIYTDARTIEIITSLMDELGVARAGLIGNSIGGRIAWSFAAAHRERTDRLVLIAPDGFASTGFEYGKEPEIPLAMNLMRYALPRGLLRQNLDQSYGDPAALTEETADRYYDLMLAPGSRAALIARLRQTVLTDPRPILETLRMPVLLLWGEKDALIPVSNARDYEAVLPDARLETFPSLGHVPHEEDPEATLPVLRAFLSETDPER